MVTEPSGALDRPIRQLQSEPIIPIKVVLLEKWVSVDF